MLKATFSINKLPNLIIIFLSFILFIPQVFAKNQLYHHASPYLAMHGNDPVNWMEWSQEALEKAKKEHKLIFVSIGGYYACLPLVSRYAPRKLFKP